MPTQQSFPNSKQKANDHTCGPVCLANVYQYFHKNIVLNQILKDLGTAEGDATYPSQLARHLNGSGLETIILSSSPFIISPTWKNKSKEQIIDRLKKWVTHNSKDRWLTNVLHLLFYLQEGGNVKILDLSTSIMDEYLDKGYLLIPCLEESWLWQKRKIHEKAEYDDIKGHTRGHFVVVYDKKNGDYRVSDPYPTGLRNRQGLYNISKQKLLISTLVWTAQIIAVKK